MRIGRSLALAAGAAVAVVSLSGCMRMDADVWVSEQATVERASLTVAVNAAALQSLGGGNSKVSIDDFKKTMREGLGAGLAQTGDSPLASAATDQAEALDENCQWSQTSSEYTMECQYTSAQLGALTGNAGEGGIRLALAGDTIEVSMDSQDGSSSQTGMAASMGIEATARLHFPGPVTSVQGAGVGIDAQDADTAVIYLLHMDASGVEIRASKGQGQHPWLIVALVAAGALLLVFAIAGIVLARRASRSSTGADTADGAGDSPDAEADGTPDETGGADAGGSESASSDESMDGTQNSEQ